MPEKLIVFLLAVWVGAIVVLVRTDRAEKYLWIPVLFALAGVLSSILPVAISANAAAVTNASILILFIFSFGTLGKDRHPPIAFAKYRA